VLVEEEAKAVLTLRREASEAPFTQEDARRAELFARHAASAFLLMELAVSRRRLAEKAEELQKTNHHKDAFVAGVASPTCSSSSRRWTPPTPARWGASGSACT